MADLIFNGYSLPQNAPVQEIHATPTRRKYCAPSALNLHEPVMTDTELHLREAIIAKCRWMNATGLNQGTSGNISARHGDTISEAAAAFGNYGLQDSPATKCC